MATNRVLFGLSQVHYAVWDESTSKYGEVKAAPGGVSLSLNREGDSSTFYADNVPFAAFYSDSGYTGDLELATAEKQMMVDLLGWEVDANGALLQVSGNTAPSFALMFEVSSNVRPERFVFYNCSLSRPEFEANTTNDSTDPDTRTLNFTAVNRELTYGTDKIVLPATSIEDDKTDTKAHEAYTKFFETVYLPTPVAA